MGLKLEGAAQEENEGTECWPDNWLPFQVFCSLETQWNVGPRSIIGMRYESIPGALEEFGIKKKGRAEIRQCLRVMEQEALKVFNSKNG